MKQLAFIIALAALSLTSCKKELPEVGGTAAQKVANEWWVTLTQNGTDVFRYGTFKLSTYNTATNGNEIWVDDLKHSRKFKVKAQADFSNLTFSAAQQANEYSATTKVDIQNGKVLPGAAHSKTGNVTDSIYMTVQFSDRPGETYTISGHARTQFAEDEY